MHPTHLRPVESLPMQAKRIDGSLAAPDPAVIAQACEGDVRAWAQLYQALYLGVFRQLRYLTGDATIAEELAQETFAQAMTFRTRYDLQRAFVAWLHGIAINVARKHWRKQRNSVRAHQRFELVTQLGSGSIHGDPDDGFVRRERSRALYAVLQDIPIRWREAFVLCELQGLSTSEAAEALHISPENLGMRVHRARNRIRAELMRRGWLVCKEHSP